MQTPGEGVVSSPFSDSIAYLPWVAYKAKRQTCPFGSLGSQVLAPDSRPHPCRKSGEAAFLTAVIFWIHVQSYEDGW